MSRAWTLPVLMAALVGAVAQRAVAQSYTFTHMAGTVGGAGDADGQGSDARFAWPRAVAVDASGTLFVADTLNHTVRSVTAAGVVTTLAGQAGSPGSTDGLGSVARFNRPAGVALDASGTVYVADMRNHTIRKISPAGEVKTLAGQAGAVGAADGNGSAARFSSPNKLAVDIAGTLYVADSGNHTIRKISPVGDVTTLAGQAGVAGSADGVGSSARFNLPIGIAVDQSGTVYVSGDQTVRKVTVAGIVTTLAGLAGVQGSANGTGSAARFSNPQAIAVDAVGHVYVADFTNNAIRRMTPDGTVTTFAGQLTWLGGSTDGIASAARFEYPEGVAVDGAGIVYVADTNNSTIRKISTTGVVSTLAGAAAVRGMEDGTGSAARFSLPRGVAVDASRTVYVSDLSNNTIRRVTQAGVVTTLAGLPGSAGHADGTGSAARFNSPGGLAVDSGGALYVADIQNHTIRKVAPDGTVSTLAGLAGVSGSMDGVGAAARFNAPEGIAVGAAGELYVADRLNQTIRRITADGAVTTLAGLSGVSGSADGTGSAARFYFPSSVTVDSSGTLYVADGSALRVRKVAPGGVVTTLTGSGGCLCGFAYSPAVAVDAGGTVFVADVGPVSAQGSQTANTILSVSPAGVITTLGGLAGAPGSADGTGTAARFNRPSGLAIDGAGTLYVADTWNHAIRRGEPANDDGDGDGLPTTWENQFGLNPASSSGDDGPAGDPDGDGRTNLQEYQDGTHPRGFFTRYFAEGATSPFFDTTLALVNLSTTSAASVLLRLQRADGSAVPHHLSMEPRTRRTLDVKAVPGMAAAEFSTVIESDEPIVADRTMTWDASGYGSHAETSIASPATTWYLAEGATHSGFNLFYLLQNPNGVTANVQVTYLRPAPQAPLVRTYPVGPHARANIWVDLEPGLENTDVSAVFTSDVPIIVERAMYLDQPGRPFGAGHESAGIPAPATEWFLAEGATGSFFDLFVLIANPGDEDAAVTATFLRPVGPPVVKHYTVAAKSRFNVWVDLEDALLADTAVSTVVTSTNAVPIIVERAMWWPGPAWAGAHNSAGLTSTGRTWALAEGEVGGPRGLETYILIANRGDADVARVTLLYEDGTHESKDVKLPASSRTNVAVAAEFPNAMGRRFGAIVEALGASPEIAVERAMYGNASGIVWATGTNAVATRVQ